MVEELKNWVVKGRKYPRPYLDVIATFSTYTKGMDYMRTANFVEWDMVFLVWEPQLVAPVFAGVYMDQYWESLPSRYKKSELYIDMLPVREKYFLGR